MTAAERMEYGAQHDIRACSPVTQTPALQTSRKSALSARQPPQENLYRGSLPDGDVENESWIKASR